MLKLWKRAVPWPPAYSFNKRAGNEANPKIIGMEFRVALQPRPLPQQITLRDAVFLAGSCFTEHMSSRLAQHKFRVSENPHGILFNPASICRSLGDVLDGRVYGREDLFMETHGIWSSWHFHSRFSDPDPEVALRAMNQSVFLAREAIRSSGWLILTLGSAYVYELSDGSAVANCHRAPANTFTRRLLQPDEILAGLDPLLHRLRILNPGMRFMFTVSPVRHLREGFVDNNRSKAALIYSVHQLADKFDDVFYFPAYELVIDDLRDYRFFAEDMAHPNYQATRYVWEKFMESCIDSTSADIMREIQDIHTAMAHKPRHPQSGGHRQFLEKHAAQVRDLAARCPYLDFSRELAYFEGETV